MTIVIAALDSSAAARPVLETARRIAAMTDGTVQAIHVPDGPGETPRLLAARAGVPMTIIEGSVSQALVGAVRDPSVSVAVLGARATPHGRRPIGTTALRVLEAAEKPIVIVPPDARASGDRPLHHLLLPLDGTQATARPVAAFLDRLAVGTDPEVTVLHVFTPSTVPRALDRSRRDLFLWADEFLARSFPRATSVELRAGAVGDAVAEVATDENVDMIVLSWSQDSSEGHVVRDVLARSTLPVLLLPADHG
jgi:nucleotide-binding universal stress UspA family protein